mmetsp:Transcript_136/g.348  ORF Transcript_136/g.348 Transcript_136/m.348 type:complete len:225 (+) Transcript_136:87-761(+)
MLRPVATAMLLAATWSPAAAAGWWPFPGSQASGSKNDDDRSSYVRPQLQPEPQPQPGPQLQPRQSSFSAAAQPVEDVMNASAWLQPAWQTASPPPANDKTSSNLNVQPSHTPTLQCTNAGDRDLWKAHNSSLPGTVFNCGKRCKDTESCISRCTATQVHYSAQCADCFGMLGVCVRTHCHHSRKRCVLCECSMAPTHGDCATQFFRCTGFSKIGTPFERRMGGH